MGFRIDALRGVPAQRISDIDGAVAGWMKNEPTIDGKTHLSSMRLEHEITIRHPSQLYLSGVGLVERKKVQEPITRSYFEMLCTFFWRLLGYSIVPEEGKWIEKDVPTTWNTRIKMEKCGSDLWKARVISKVGQESAGSPKTKVNDVAFKFLEEGGIWESGENHDYRDLCLLGAHDRKV